VAASIPCFVVTEDVAIRLVPHLKEFVYDVQDKIIRGLYESGATSVADSEIDIDAICKYLAESESITGGRFTKVAATEWCEVSGFNDALRLRFAELLGIGEDPSNEEAKQVEIQVTGYVDKIAALTGSKTYYAPEVAKKLLKAFEIANIGDKIAERFVTRLEDMIKNPNDVPDMMSL
jgi:hypothetical protein